MKNYLFLSDPTASSTGGLKSVLIWATLPLSQKAVFAITFTGPL